eukprot:683142-Rhodomonas_salina.3
MPCCAPALTAACSTLPPEGQGHPPSTHSSFCSSRSLLLMPVCAAIEALGLAQIWGDDKLLQ